MGDELTRLSLEVELNTLCRWRDLNSRARAVQDAMPPDLRRHVEENPADPSTTVLALALAHPDMLEVNLALVGALIERLEREGSLSHPSDRLGGERPSDGEGAMDEAEIEEQLARIERRTGDLERVAERITAALARIETALDRAGR